MTSDKSGHAEVKFIGVGDCGPVHGPADGFQIEGYSELVLPTLHEADITFANCERQYSERGVRNEINPHGRQPPEMAQFFTDCGFDAVTIANNHMYDYGPDALIDTRQLLNEKGIKVTGAGRDIDEARQPAIVERNGIKVGFLGYCSVIPEGGEAGVGKVGISPLRVETEYELRGPHATPRVITRPNEDDLSMMLRDIRELKKLVDIVVVAQHWGVVWIPRVISDYQIIAAHACIDSGADLVLGHHAHVPKAIEVYKGKAIFYSLGNFCMTKPFPSPKWSEEPWKHGAVRNYTDQNPDYPLLPYGMNASRSLIAKATFGKSGLTSVSFQPILIDTRYRPEPLQSDHPGFSEILDYLEWASEGFTHTFRQQGKEILVTS